MGSTTGNKEWADERVCQAKEIQLGNKICVPQEDSCTGRSTEERLYASLAELNERHARELKVAIAERDEARERVGQQHQRLRQMEERFYAARTSRDDKICEVLAEFDAIVAEVNILRADLKALVR